MAKKTYTVKSAVDHDNERFESGSSITLDEKIAKPLLDANVIEESTGNAPAAEPSDPAERLAAITGAIGQLDPNDTDLWLRDGKPDVSAIVSILGWNVSAAERNAAWASMQPSV